MFKIINFYIGLQAIAYSCGDTLEKLNLKGLTGMNRWTFNALSVACRHLKQLNVSGQLNKTSSSALKVSKELKSHDVEDKSRELARGDFYGHPLARLGETGISSLVTKSLETLIMTDSTVNGNTVTELIQNQGQMTLIHPKHVLSNLLNVQLKGCKNVSNDALIVLGLTCLKLETLLLGACELISDDGLVALTTGALPIEKEKGYIPKSKQMLAYEAKKRKKKKKEVVKGCLLLRRLGLCGCWRVSDTGIQSIAKYCTQLQLLDVRENTSLTNKSLDYIQDSLYNLELLKLSALAKFEKDRLSRCARALPLVDGTCYQKKIQYKVFENI